MNLPDKKYQIVYADPPWDIGSGGGGHWNLINGESRLPYPTMGVEEICELPVAPVCNSDCKLFLWTVNKYLREAFNVITAWGFTYSTTLVWAKTPNGIGLGGTFSLTTEYLLFASRGKIGADKRWDTTWWNAQRRKHSQKPEVFREVINDTFPADNKVELFAREQVEGWDALGNEINGMDMRENLELLGKWFDLCE